MTVLLLQAGANADNRDGSGVYPLHLAAAAEGDQASLCGILSQATSNYNAVVEGKDDKERPLTGTALDIAYRHRHPRAAHNLLSTGSACRYVVLNRAASHVQVCWRMMASLNRHEALSEKQRYRGYLRLALLLFCRVSSS